MKPSLWSKLKAYRARRASLRPFQTFASMRMTGCGLLKYIQEIDTYYRSHLNAVQPEIIELYKHIIDTVENIGHNNYKKLIPLKHSAELRALICHYFKDLNDFHIQGLSGSDNRELKRGYEKVVVRLIEIQMLMSVKGTKI